MFTITHSAIGTRQGGRQRGKGGELDKIWKMRGKQYRKVFIK